MPNVPDLHRFLVSYWVANPTTYDLKQDVLFGLVISTLQNQSVGYQGIEPRYLKMLNFTGNKHLFVAYHYVVLLSTQLFTQHSYYSIAHIKNTSTRLANHFLKKENTNPTPTPSNFLDVFYIKTIPTILQVGCKYHNTWLSRSDIYHILNIQHLVQSRFYTYG